MSHALTAEERLQRAEDIGLMYDECDRDIVTNNTWYVSADGHVRTNGATDSTLFHRLVMGRPPEPGMVVKHVDGNRSNNRRSNLRWTVNGASLRRDGRDDMRCITVRERKHQLAYQLCIRKGLASVLIRTYTTIDEAIAARDAAFAVMKHFGVDWEAER